MVPEGTQSEDLSEIRSGNKKILGIAAENKLKEVYTPNANIWQITRSAPRTSCMKARLVSLGCFVCTMVPQKSLASSSIWSALFLFYFIFFVLKKFSLSILVGLLYFAVPIICCVSECHEKG